MSASAPIEIRPDDEANRLLLSRVHPLGYTNPTPSGRYNLVVIGAGTAGLVSAAAAAGLGAKVALIERHLTGGDCLNVGCVPSKSLIAAARAAAVARDPKIAGLTSKGVEVGFAGVMERMRKQRAHLASVDSVERFGRLGVDVYLGDAKFTGPDSVEVDGRRLQFTRAVIATGSRAAAPPIPGIDAVPYLNNETLFELTELPKRLGIVGGGPIGCEMAQAFCRFGSEVAVFEELPHVLPREDADAAAIIDRQLRSEGVKLICGVRVPRVERVGEEIVIPWSDKDGEKSFACDRLLIAVGRAPNVDGLGLETAGVVHDRTGVKVDDSLRTTNKRIYAAGDVASRYQFTHLADAMARIVVQNALFPTPRRKFSTLTIPWCTYTSPEIAHVGLYGHDADAGGIAIDTYNVKFAEVDRAVLEDETDGFVRVHVRRGSDQILGATIVAEDAGDLISEITAAIYNKIGLGALANVIHPYPTRAEAIRKAGDAYNRTRLTPTVSRIFNWWFRRRR